jgi:hypothetical protein
MCDCIKLTNESLKNDHPELNTRVYVPVMMNMKTGLHTEPKAVILTEKLDDKVRKKPVKLFATYCPFCGAKYE